MARTLPWLKEQGKQTASNTKSVPAKHSVKQSKRLDPHSNPLPPLSTLPPPLASHVPSVRAVRTPSTSPPPQPPSEEEMQAGLEHDDIYIMVEDEFHAVAKTFTQHLHHAEYLRLKNLARSQNPSALANLARPTDSITALREETKRKKEQESKAARRNAALQEMTDRKRPPRPKDSDDETPDDEAEEEELPWAGTTLHELMTSPNKKQLSLTGIHGVTLRTRAAAGIRKLGRPTHPQKQPNPAPSRTTKNQPPRPEPPSSHPRDSETTTDSDDLDLDNPPSRTQPKPKSKTVAPKHPTPYDPPPFPISKTPNPPSSHRSNLNPSRRNPAINNTNLPTIPTVPPQLQPLFSTTATTTPSSSLLTLKRRATQKAQAEAAAKKRAIDNPNINEIPIFLV